MVDGEIMENESYACKAAGYINKAIDGFDRLTYELMFPRDLVQYSNGKLVNQERELPGWMKAISDFEKSMVNRALCGKPEQSEGTPKVIKAGLPSLEITGK